MVVIGAVIGFVLFATYAQGDDGGNIGDEIINPTFSGEVAVPGTVMNSDVI